MTTIRLKIDREGERADAFLARSLPDFTRSAAQSLMAPRLLRQAF